MSDEDICRTCGQTRAWHDENRPQHPFRDSGDLRPDGLGKKDQKEKQKTRVEVREWPHDPVLRIALMNKGILTMADIEAAEHSLREAAKNDGTIIVGPTKLGPGHGDDISTRSGDSS